MSRKLFLMCLISALSITSAYAKCDGGEEVTNTAGTTFCKSNVNIVNWWSAFAWCKANGLRLATIYELCPSWEGNSGSGACPEASSISSEGIFFTATAKNEENFFSVGYGSVYEDRTRSGNHYQRAICL